MLLDDIILPDDLLWVNEFDWNPVEQNIDRSLTGALMVQEGQLANGRPIILSGNGEAGWVSREIVNKLFFLSKQPNKNMVLILPDEREFNVIFDRTIIPFVKAVQVVPHAYPNDKCDYFLTLHLLTTSDIGYI